MQNRRKLATRNIIASVLVNILIFPIQFINRYYMVKYLGITYLGITSLYTNIISVLSLADLGVGAAIVFLLYKPLADKDYDKVSLLMKYYRNIYRIIAFVIFFLGISVIPFLQLFLHNSINYSYVYLLFIIYLAGAASSYLFSYNQSLLLADQKNRIFSWIYLIVSYAMISGQIITVKLFRNPILYAVFYVFTNFVTNIFVSIYVNRNYKLNYHVNDKLSEIEKEEMKSNIFGNMVMRISGVIVTGTDSMLLSAFTNVIQVGLYANYTTLTNVISKIMTQGFNALTGSIGNYIVSNTNDKNKVLFFNLQFLNFYVLNVAILGICFASKDVIILWLGEKYVISSLNTLLLALSFYFMNYRMLGWSYISVYGLSKYMKLFSVSEMIINFVASLILLEVFKLGITGIILGTIFSTLLTVGWQDPYVIFHKGFRSSMKKYIYIYIKNVIILLIEMISLKFVLLIVNTYTNFSLVPHLVITIVCILIIGIIFPLVCYYNSEEEKYLFSLLKSIFFR